MTVPTYRHSSPDTTAPEAPEAPEAVEAPADAATLDGGPAAACPACPHPLARHDPIGVRFCRATAVGGFDRGCVCRTG
jgi:hypothetical protein